MKLAIRAFQDTKLELFIGHLDIVLPTIPQNEAPKQNRGFLVHRIVALTKRTTYPLNCWLRKIVDMLSCNFFVPPLQVAGLQEFFVASTHEAVEKSETRQRINGHPSPGPASKMQMHILYSYI